jgi:hypothetical protein
MAEPIIYIMVGVSYVSLKDTEFFKNNALSKLQTQTWLVFYISIGPTQVIGRHLEKIIMIDKFLNYLMTYSCSKQNGFA